MKAFSGKSSYIIGLKKHSTNSGKQINSTNTKIAQKFTANSDMVVYAVELWQASGGGLAGTVSIWDDSGGSPNSLVTGLTVSGVVLDDGDSTVVKFDTPTTLTEDETYWLVFERTSGTGYLNGESGNGDSNVQYYDNGTSTWNNDTLNNLYHRISSLSLPYGILNEFTNPILPTSSPANPATYLAQGSDNTISTNINLDSLVSEWTDGASNKIRIRLRQSSDDAETGTIGWEREGKSHRISAHGMIPTNDADTSQKHLREYGIHRSATASDLIYRQTISDVLKLDKTSITFVMVVECKSLAESKGNQGW